MARRRLAVACLAALAALAPAPPRASAAPAAPAWPAASAKADALVEARWRGAKGLPVAPRADDAEFLRRVTLDLTGTIPTEAETADFLNDPTPGKRVALVDRLLASERHADWFATWYGNLLVGTAVRNRTLNRRTFNEWLREQFRKNRPYDEVVYDLLTASGNSDTNGAVGLMSSFETSAADAAGKTARLFLGVQIQCAQCHDHPYDKRVKQDDFNAYAAFFVTTTHRRNMTPGSPEVSFDVASWPVEEVRAGRPRTAPGARPGQPLRLEAQPARGQRPGALPEARFLLGKALKDVPGVDRRTMLAKWTVAPGNPWFADAMANRLWAYFTGRGIVHPVDDFSSANRPSNPALLDHLADEFRRGAFDLRRLIRVIVGTEAYQRSSRVPRGQERPDPSLHAVAAVRPLSVEQSFDSIFRATGVEDALARGATPAARLQARAMGRGALVDPRMLVYQQFRRAFDDDEQAEEESFTGTIPRGLLMMNGPQVQQMISAAARTGPLAAILRAERGDRERVRRVYLLALSRPPSPGEASAALEHLHTSRSEQEGYEDLLWALVNTTEFMSNH